MIERSKLHSDFCHDDLSFPPALGGGWTVLTTSGIRMDPD